MTGHLAAFEHCESIIFCRGQGHSRYCKCGNEYTSRIYIVTLSNTEGGSLTAYLLASIPIIVQNINYLKLVEYVPNGDYHAMRKVQYFVQFALYYHQDTDIYAVIE